MILTLGIFAGVGNLAGCFASRERLALLDRLTTERHGIPINAPGAEAFRRKFPPPPIAEDDAHGSVTHIVKTVMQTEDGTLLMGSLSYMQRDGTRTTTVATFDDVRRWASDTSYPWVAWILTATGACWTVGRGISGKLKEQASTNS
jgi:hypothetical protein